MQRKKILYNLLIEKLHECPYKLMKNKGRKLLLKRYLNLLYKPCQKTKPLLRPNKMTYPYSPYQHYFSKI